MRQVFDAARLESAAKRAAHLITAFLIADLTSWADDDTVAKAMERFPATVRDRLEDLCEDIEGLLAEHLMPASNGPTAFTVVLDGLANPTKKINVIKVVREITGLGLKEAKDLVEGAPQPVKENIAQDEAHSLKRKLEDGGAKVSLKAHARITGSNHHHPSPRE